MSGGSIDWLMLDSSRRPIPLPQERILLTAEGTEATVTIPDQPPQNNSVSGSGGSRKLKEAGTTYITNQRLLFVRVTPAQQHVASGSFDTLALPHLSIISTSFIQPYFAANYLTLSVHPADGGGLSNNTMIDVRFKDRGMFDFVMLLDKVWQEALSRRREERLGEPLPMYVAPETAPPPGQPAAPENTSHSDIDGLPTYESLN